MDILITTPFHPAYMTKDRIQKAQKLKLIMTAGVGSDHIDLQSAADKGMTVVEVTGVPACCFCMSSCSCMPHHPSFARCACLVFACQSMTSMRHGLCVCQVCFDCRHSLGLHFGAALQLLLSCALACLHPSAWILRLLLVALCLVARLTLCTMHCCLPWCSNFCA